MNPFDAPADGGLDPFDDKELATLGQRFAGALIDTLIIFACFIPGALTIPLLPMELDAYGDPEPHPVSIIILGLGLLAIVGITFYQWYLIATEGKTIGKKAVGTRIVKENGDPVDFVTGVIVRLWLLNFVTGILNQCCLGWIVSLVDALFIFAGPERQCLHDKLASTKVIQD